MSEAYDEAIAYHYDAYRPPLHKMILDRILDEGERFENGLDIGCGTGYSAIALANFCSQVYGVEPSTSMLKKAMPHKTIAYLNSFAHSLPIPDNSVDIVTFAGSLFYAKSAALIKELHRVCRDQSTIIVYDFNVLMDDVLRYCDIKIDQSPSDYDFDVNFDDTNDFSKIVVHKEQVHLAVTASELAHILFADATIYKAFVKKYKLTDPFPQLVGKLALATAQRKLKVKIYFSKYERNPA